MFIKALFLLTSSFWAWPFIYYFPRPSEFVCSYITISVSFSSKFQKLTQFFKLWIFFGGKICQNVFAHHFEILTNFISSFITFFEKKLHFGPIQRTVVLLPFAPDQSRQCPLILLRTLGSRMALFVGLTTSSTPFAGGTVLYVCVKAFQMHR